MPHSFEIMPMASVQVDEDFIIVQSPDNLVSGFDVTKVALTYDNNQTIILDIFRVKNAWLSKDHLHNSAKLHASKTGWHAWNSYDSVTKCKCFKKPLILNHDDGRIKDGRKFVSGSTNKGYTLQKFIKSTKHKMKVHEWKIKMFQSFLKHSYYCHWWIKFRTWLIMGV